MDRTVKDEDRIIKTTEVSARATERAAKEMNGIPEKIDSST
ncbi:hypothetical protein ACQKMV_00460 [Lysinibacillus sp. NPDC094403]